MLLAFTICNLFILTRANPFHKYPFVFLLDLGNEELEKTNSEQIRVSVPGGSIGLRYPAIGDGDTISHVRVSGIDFGTDLNANIIDGGPGYKYVVLLLMGNSGVPYDAVLTVQTVANEKNDKTLQQIGSNISGESNEIVYNNNVENFNDVSEVDKGSNQIYIEKNNAQLTQSSSNVYSYIKDEVINSEGKKLELEENDKDKYERFHEADEFRAKTYDVDNEDSNQSDFSEIELESSENEDDQDIQAVEKQSSVFVPDKISEDDDLDEDTQIETRGNSKTDYSEELHNSEEVEKINQLNDEEIHYDDDKYKDTNNNDYDNDDSFAVAS